MSIVISKDFFGAKPIIRGCACIIDLERVIRFHGYCNYHVQFLQHRHVSFAQSRAMK